MDIRPTPPERNHHVSTPRRCRATVTVAFRKPGQPWELCRGRVAQALTMLAAKGERGLTSLEIGNARLSAAIFRLRREHGLTIITETENHSGPFAGHHGVYILKTPIELGNAEAEAA